MNLIKLDKQYTEPTEKYNLLSVCVFRLKNSYKKTQIYSKGLSLLINNFEKLFPENFYLRIYYDTSVLDNNDDNMIEDTENIWKPLFEIAKTKKRIQLVKYDIPKYRLNEIYHDGLIGTIMRFLPFFKTKDTKNIGLVITSDIDKNTITGFKKILEYIEVYNKSNTEFLYVTRRCYHTLERFSKISKYFKIDNPINAGGIITSIKFPKKLLNDFFTCINNKNNIDKCEYMNSFLEIHKNIVFDKNENDPLIKNRKSESRFPYGIDELFCLCLREYLDINKIKYVIYLLNIIFDVVYNVYLSFKDGLVDQNTFNFFIKSVLGKYYNNKLNLLQNYEILDNMIFLKSYAHTDKRGYFLFNLKKIFRNVLLNKTYKKYGFKDDVEIKCIIDIDTDSEHSIIIRNK